MVWGNLTKYDKVIGERLLNYWPGGCVSCEELEMALTHCLHVVRRYISNQTMDSARSIWYIAEQWDYISLRTLLHSMIYPPFVKLQTQFIYSVCQEITKPYTHTHTISFRLIHIVDCNAAVAKNEYPFT